MRRDALQARRSAVASTTRRLAYEVRGDGPPLVAPAWWASHLELDWQSPDVRRYWEGVAKDHTLSATTGSASACRTAPCEISI
jgi:hypothetical protein